MQILMRKGEGETPEWFVIEMQGDLESRNKEHLEGKFIGDLHYNKEGVPIMIIGHHILYGKVCSSITDYSFSQHWLAGSELGKATGFGGKSRERWRDEGQGGRGADGLGRGDGDEGGIQSEGHHQEEDYIQESPETNHRKSAQAGVIHHS